MKTTTGKTGFGIPIAIIVAGLTIGGAIFFALSPRSSADRGAPAGSQAVGGDFRLPSDSDHVRGEAGAKVAIVEFSDLECPFCARLHPTLTRIVDENPDVKWVYRHFPLTSIHSRARGAAIASECVARLGGNDAFWKFTDTAFANQNRLGDALYKELASSYGIDAAAFSACIADKSVAAEVDADNDEAISSGGRGTPFAVVVSANGALVPFSGALAYEQIKGLVDQALIN